MNIEGIKILTNEEYSNIKIFVIDYLSDELKNIIKAQLSTIRHGSVAVNENGNFYSYKNVLNNFLIEYNRKQEDQKLGLIGELLAHVLIKNYEDKLQTISILKNKEDSGFRKGFDIIFYDLNNDCIRYSEVKSGKVNAETTINDKNKERLSKATKDISDKLLSVDDYNDNRHDNRPLRYNFWNSAQIDIQLTVIDNDNKVYIQKLLDNDYNNHETNTKAIIVSVVFNENNDTLDLNEVIDFYEQHKNENFMDDVLIFSIQKHTYELIVDFLKGESYD